MKVQYIKAGGGFLIFACIVIFGLLPLKLAKFQSNPRLISLTNCFSGGLFLAMGLFHVLPEAAQVLDAGHHGAHHHIPKSGECHGHSHVFAWAHFFCLAAFSLVLLVDKILFGHSHSHSDPHNHSHDHANVSHGNLIVKHADKHSSDSHADHKVGHSGHSHDSLETQIVRLDIQTKAPTTNTVMPASVLPVAHGHSHDIDFVGKSALSAYLVIFALGVHGLFSGLAFGVVKSRKQALAMFIAMIAHKWSEALSVGVSLAKARMSQFKAISLLVFLAFLTPLGIALGWLLAFAHVWIGGVCMALSAGTFLYISCAEILVEEFSSCRDRFLKFGAYLGGVVLVILFGFLE